MYVAGSSNYASSYDVFPTFVKIYKNNKYYYKINVNYAVNVHNSQKDITYYKWNKIEYSEHMEPYGHVTFYILDGEIFAIGIENYVSILKDNLI